MTNFSVADLLKTIAIENSLNVNLSLDKIRGQITCNLERVPVKDVLLLCCKDCGLNLTVESGIIIVAPWQPSESLPQVTIARDFSGLFSMDFSGCTLDALTRRLVAETGDNIVFAPSLAERKVFGFGVGMSVDQMMENISASNGLRCARNDSGTWMIGERGRRQRFVFSSGGLTLRLRHFVSGCSRCGTGLSMMWSRSFPPS